VSEQLAVVLLGAAVAGFVQGLSGFGFAMTAVTFWIWVLEPRLVATLGVVGALAGQVFTVATSRRALEWRPLAPFLLGALAGLPLGLYLLPRLDVPLFKGVIGLLLVTLCPLMFLAPRLPPITRGGRVGDVLAGSVGGVMGGLGGATGVVPTLWCTLRGFDKDRQRGIIQNFNLAALSVTFACYLGTGIVTREMLPLCAAIVPALIVPSLIGRKLYLGISELAFRQVVLGLLTAGGMAMLASAAPVLQSRWLPG